MVGQGLVGWLIDWILIKHLLGVEVIERLASETPHLFQIGKLRGQAEEQEASLKTQVWYRIRDSGKPCNIKSDNQGLRNYRPDLSTEFRIRIQIKNDQHIKREKVSCFEKLTVLSKELEAYSRAWNCLKEKLISKLFIFGYLPNQILNRIWILKNA